jgi:hypothetical protein
MKTLQDTRVIHSVVFCLIYKGTKRAISGRADETLGLSTHRLFYSVSVDKFQQKACQKGVNNIKESLEGAEGKSRPVSAEKKLDTSQFHRDAAKVLDSQRQ